MVSWSHPGPQFQPAYMEDGELLVCHIYLNTISGLPPPPQKEYRANVITLCYRPSNLVTCYVKFQLPLTPRLLEKIFYRFAENDRLSRKRVSVESVCAREVVLSVRLDFVVFFNFVDERGPRLLTRFVFDGAKLIIEHVGLHAALESTC